MRVSSFLYFVCTATSVYASISLHSADTAPGAANPGLSRLPGSKSPDQKRSFKSTRSMHTMTRGSLSSRPSPSHRAGGFHRHPTHARSDDIAELDTRPTPAPTGPSSDRTTVHISSKNDFALLLPSRQGELVSDSENDGVSYCTPGSSATECSGPRMQEGFITAAEVVHGHNEHGSYIQVTGCMNPHRSTLDPSDGGGQLDVRFPNGAKCTFGGYGASFIEIVEPAANRFCLRCCDKANDQINCNSHRDTQGCETVIPGRYDFPESGVSCS